jgi:Na+-transporting NADH:ubiquinone oxidoreductase subunit F
MIEIFIGLITISIIAAILALLLEIADHYIADYGEKHILVNEEKDLLVKGGSPLLFSLAEKSIFLPSACGGKGTCSYCKVEVPEGGGSVLPTETPYLSKDELENNVRLACMLKVKNDLKIQIPDELFLVKQFRVKVEKIERLTPDIKNIRFRILSPEEGISFKAGQYVQLEIPKYELTRESEFRAYSIASAAEENQAVELIITKVPEGVVSTYAHDYLQVGEELIMRGPFGEFCLLCNLDRDILLIATGSGLAPIRSMIYQIRQEGIKQKVTLFFGDRKPEDLLYDDELREFERTLDDFTYIPTLSRTTEEDGWTGEKGRVTDLIEKHIPDNAAIDVYICGVPAMVESCQKLLVEKGVPQVRIWFDKFE